jgi:hypothetical protein
VYNGHTPAHTGKLATCNRFGASPSLFTVTMSDCLPVSWIIICYTKTLNDHWTHAVLSESVCLLWFRPSRFIRFDWCEGNSVKQWRVRWDIIPSHPSLLYHKATRSKLKNEYNRKLSTLVLTMLNFLFNMVNTKSTQVQVCDQRRLVTLIAKLKKWKHKKNMSQQFL